MGTVCLYNKSVTKCNGKSRTFLCFDGLKKSHKYIVGEIYLY